MTRLVRIKSLSIFQNKHTLHNSVQMINWQPGLLCPAKNRVLIRLGNKPGLCENGHHVMLCAAEIENKFFARIFGILSKMMGILRIQNPPISKTHYKGGSPQFSRHLRS